MAPTLIFFPREFQVEEPRGLQTMGSQRPDMTVQLTLERKSV